jgi:hypothetical protein
MITPDKQLDYFKQGVAALGGSRSAATAISCSERMMTRLLAGQAALHEGFLADISTALLKHAELCRRLERRLSPAFVSNLVDGQAQEDGRRKRQEA